MAPTSSSGPEASQPTNGSQPSARGNITLPQVLSMMERRILQLESNMKSGFSSDSSVSSSTIGDKSVSVIEKDEGLKSLLEEYEARFDMLATQFNEMKDVMLKLQSYTLEVNKLLLEKSNILEEPSVFLSNTYLEGTPMSISELNLTTIPETSETDETDELDIESQDQTVTFSSS